MLSVNTLCVVTMSVAVLHNSLASSVQCFTILLRETIKLVKNITTAPLKKSVNGKSFPVLMACKHQSKLVNLPFVGNYR
jgi:hypothetical protein